MKIIFLIILFIVLFFISCFLILAFYFLMIVLGVDGYDLFMQVSPYNIVLMAFLPSAGITYRFAKIWLSDQEKKDK